MEKIKKESKELNSFTQWLTATKYGATRNEDLTDVKDISKRAIAIGSLTLFCLVFMMATDSNVEKGTYNVLSEIGGGGK